MDARPPEQRRHVCVFYFMKPMIHSWQTHTHSFLASCATSMPASLTHFRQRKSITRRHQAMGVFGGHKHPLNLVHLSICAVPYRDETMQLLHGLSSSAALVAYFKRCNTHWLVGFGGAIHFKMLLTLCVVKQGGKRSFAALLRECGTSRWAGRREWARGVNDLLRLFFCSIGG